MNLSEKIELAKVKSVEFENQSAMKLLEWAQTQFPQLCFACSFGAEDVVLVDMLQQFDRSTDIFYLDTDFHFKETYQTRDRLSERYGKKFIQVRPKLTPAQQASQYGDALWKRNPDLCCELRKVDPLGEILQKYDAWITGIRRDQATTRANAKKVEYDHKFGLIKLNPLADWKTNDVWQYIRRNNVIYNPLHDQDYPSIGCSYCTNPVKPGQDPRSGRWAGAEKTECGLHPHKESRD
ncbi:phosphoadenylyl-sulfate reductase [Ammoniphilus sp. 3BR4]|uniref:phosphoadenylyl-sulfate reductase n=1 Tax=Ammoniphilus sp. 3BR4 TaxID=3158265 RepID=UPI003467A873